MASYADCATVGVIWSLGRPFRAACQNVYDAYYRYYTRALEDAWKEYEEDAHTFSRYGVNYITFSLLCHENVALATLHHAVGYKVSDEHLQLETEYERRWRQDMRERCPHR